MSNTPPPNNPNNISDPKEQNGSGGESPGALKYHSYSEMEEVYRAISKKNSSPKAQPISKQRKEVSEYIDSSIESVEQYGNALDKKYKKWSAVKAERSKYKIYGGSGPSRSGRSVKTGKKENISESIKKYY